MNKKLIVIGVIILALGSQIIYVDFTAWLKLASLLVVTGIGCGAILIGASWSEFKNG